MKAKKVEKMKIGKAAGAVGVGMMVGAAFLSSRALASDWGGDNVAVSILPLSCTLGGTLTNAHTAVVNSGQKVTGIGETLLRASCNDASGFAVYAVGMSNGQYGNTELVSSFGNNNIATGIATTGNVSNWGMKVEAGTGGTYTATIATFSTNSDGYFAVPSVYTKVASTSEGSSQGGTAELKTTYYIYTKDSQPSAEYAGKVSYLVVHPNNNIPATLEQAFERAGKTKETVGGKEYYRMQDMTSSICYTANITGEASSVELVDTRDEKIYKVTKLNDGSCWMTEDLNFDLSTTKTLTSENTDLNVINVRGYTAANGYSEEEGKIVWRPVRNTIDGTSGSFSGWTTDNNTPYSVDAGATTYYNFTAAIATNNSSAWNAATNTNLPGSPENSICPKGWRLPKVSNASESTAGSSNEFKRLNYLYNNNSTTTGAGLKNAPLYFATNGSVSGNSVSNTGTGYYWSSTVNGTGNAFGLTLTNSSVNPASSNARSTGLAIRCVSR